MCFSKHFDIIDEEDEDIAEYDTPLNNNSEILLRVADVTKFDEEVKYLADSNVVSWLINHFITRWRAGGGRHFADHQDQSEDQR